MEDFSVFKFDIWFASLWGDMRVIEGDTVDSLVWTIGFDDIVLRTEALTFCWAGAFKLICFTSDWLGFNSNYTYYFLNFDD